jgi:fatty-acyl-CoA synthase
VVSIEARRQDLLDRFPVWAPRTLHERLDDCAAAYPDRPFVITDDRTISYAETAGWSQRLADGLATLGVRRGDRVGILLANYLEFAPLKFAVSRTGAVAVPFNFLYRQEELAYVLRQSECSVLVSMTGFAGLDYLAMLDAIAPSWDSADPAAATDALPHLRHVVLLPTDGRARAGVATVDDLATLGDAHPGAAEDGKVSPADVADILYTSGTTGSPKGVQVSHDAVQRTGYASAVTRAYEDGRRILFSLPCYHMFGYVEGVLSVMFVGGAVVPQTSFDPVGYLRGVERHRATDMLCVPTMAVAILEHPDRHAYDISSLRAILCGSAPAPRWLWEKAEAEFGISEIVTGYGMTECGGAMTLTLPEDSLELTSTTVGRPKLAGAAGLDTGTPSGGDLDSAALNGGARNTADIARAALVTYKTIDPVTGDDLPAGAEGELASSGPTTMMGFWNKPDETAAALNGNWLRSGDLGLVGPDGYLRLTGRSKELYKSGGELVMPKEIEELLSSHDDISQVYALGIVDDRWGEIGCAVVVCKPGATITEGDVIELCQQRLARFKVPKQVIFLEARDLPTTPTGKVQKFRLVQHASKILLERGA